MLVSHDLQHDKVLLEVPWLPRSLLSTTACLHHEKLRVTLSLLQETAQALEGLLPPRADQHMIISIVQSIPKVLGQREELILSSGLGGSRIPEFPLGHLETLLPVTSDSILMKWIPFTRSPSHWRQDPGDVSSFCLLESQVVSLPSQVLPRCS